MSSKDPYELTRLALRHPFLVSLGSGLATGGWAELLTTGGEHPVGLLVGAGTLLVQLVLWFPKIGLLRRWAQDVVDSHVP